MNIHKDALSQPLFCPSHVPSEPLRQTIFSSMAAPPAPTPQANRNYIQCAMTFRQKAKNWDLGLRAAADDYQIESPERFVHGAVEKTRQPSCSADSKTSPGSIAYKSVAAKRMDFLRLVTNQTTRNTVFHSSSSRGQDDQIVAPEQPFYMYERLKNSDLGPRAHSRTMDRNPPARAKRHSSGFSRVAQHVLPWLQPHPQVRWRHRAGYQTRTRAAFEKYRFATCTCTSARASESCKKKKTAFWHM